MKIDKTGLFVVLIVFLVIGIVSFTLIGFGHYRLGSLGGIVAPIISYLINRYRLNKK